LSTGPAHAAEAVLHPTDSVYASWGKWCAAEARHDVNTEMVVIELTEFIKAVKAVEIVDKNEAHARADKQRWSPPPRIRVRVSRYRIPHHVAIWTLHELPCPV